MESLRPPCDSCRAPLSETYVECAACPDLHLCPGCFARGAELRSHRSDHDYFVLAAEGPVFEGSSWSADEEFALLDALERGGPGDWGEAARRLGARRTPAECERHYERFYLGGGAETSGSRTPYSYVESDSDELPRRASAAAAGYSAFRSDFEFDFDNGVERLLALDDEEEEEEEDSLGEALRCALVRAYNARLRERRRRHEIMRRHGLVAHRRFSDAWRRRVDDRLGRVASDALARTLQLVPAVRFDRLVESLRLEREAAAKLFKLHELRRRGVSTRRGRRLFEALDRSERDVEDAPALDWRRALEERPASSSSQFVDRGDGDANARKKRISQPLDIVGLEGYEKLDDAEREFCASVRIQPESFVRYRDALVAESEKNGFLRLCDARRLIKIDVNKTRKLYDMLLAEGKIKRD